MLIRGSALLNFADLVGSLGGDAEELLRARGVDPAAAGDFDRFLPSAAAAAVVADAAEALDCPDFGMRLARRAGHPDPGPGRGHHPQCGDRRRRGRRRLAVSCTTCTPDHIELIRGPRAAVFTLTTTVRQLAPPRPVGREGPRNRAWTPSA